MKHIKLEVAANPEFSQTLIRVVSQTNVGKKFGNMKGDLRKFKAANGLTIASNLFPAKDEDFRNTQTIWLQGLGSASQNATCLALPNDVAVKLCEAVEEYNEYYTQANVNRRVQAKREAAALRSGRVEYVG